MDCQFFVAINGTKKQIFEKGRFQYEGQSHPEVKNRISLPVNRSNSTLEVRVVITRDNVKLTTSCMTWDNKYILEPKTSKMLRKNDVYVFSFTVSAVDTLTICCQDPNDPDDSILDKKSWFVSSEIKYVGC